MSSFFFIYSGYRGVVLLACTFTGCLLVHRSWESRFKLLVILSCMTLLMEALAFICVVRNIYHLTWYAFWVFLETLTLLYILSRGIILPSVRRLHRILIMVLPLGVVLYLILSPAFAYLAIFSMFLELVAAGATLIDILNDVSDIPVLSKPAFWIAAGMLFFCSLSIMVFSLGTLFKTLPYPDYLLFSIAANTFMYGGFIACFVTLRRQDRWKSSTFAP